MSKQSPLNVLPQHQNLANQLDACCQYCFLMAKSAYRNQRFTEGDMLMEDYRRAKRDLDQLKAEKREIDLINSVLSDMKKRPHITEINIYNVETAIFKGGQA